MKWPNDLLVEDRKLAGILAERAMSGDVVVGIGLNVGWCPDGAARLGDGVAPLDVLGELLVAYDRLPADITAPYRAALGTIGRRVRVQLADGVLEGTATGVEADGRLVVLDACAVTHRLAVGDVVHLRPTIRDAAPPGVPDRDEDPPVASRPMPGSRLRRPPGALALGLAVLVGVAGTLGMKVSADQRTDAVTRDQEVVQVLQEPSNDVPAENYLLVGSDSREGISADDPNVGAIGSAEEITSSRSDTIMILRRERDGGATILSLPRDLWVPIAGTGESAKINSAYNGGSQRLVQTITESLGIPINHYVEIDFAGFQDLVDEIGGVEVCTEYAAQDAHSGLRLDPGCTNVDGSQALAYARSRYYEEWRDGEWQVDGTADLGRIERQQNFIRAAVTKLLQQMESDPFQVGQLVGVASAAVTVDQGLDPVKAAAALRQAAQNSLDMYSLPVEYAEHGDQSALDLDSEQAEPILDYFRGITSTPPPTATSTPDGRVSVPPYTRRP